MSRQTRRAAPSPSRNNILTSSDYDDEGNDSAFELPDLDKSMRGGQHVGNHGGRSDLTAALTASQEPGADLAPLGLVLNTQVSTAMTTPATPISNDVAAQILATLRRIQEQLTELKDSSTFNRQGSGFSAGAAGLPPGVVKPRKIEARLDALRTLKSQGVPHGDALVLYYDVPEQTIRKIIQLTVYLWMVNITSSPVWIEPETYLFLERAYNTIDIDVSKCSGLALMLYASRKNAKRAGAYTKDLGKTYITMVAQVALGIFGACRQDLFRNDSPVHPYFTRPKWGRRVDDPPRFLRADFITGLVKSSEYDFTRMIVDVICKSPTKNLEFETRKSSSKKRRKTDIHGNSLATELDDTNRYHRTPTMLDCTDLTHRTNAVRYINKAVRDGLNTSRSKVRNTLYRQFLFIIRMIQSAHPSGPPADLSLLEKEGFYVQWPTGAVTTEALQSLDEPLGWDIPLAHTLADKGDAYKLNEDLFTQMQEDFPALNCTGYYRRTARKPQPTDALFAAYEEELSKTTGGQKEMYVQQKVDINFHGLALSAMSAFLLNVPEKLTGPTLALSPLSLRAVHIWALALRSLCIKVAGGPHVSFAEKMAARGITTKDKLGLSEEELSFIMLGAYDTTVTGSGRVDKQRHRNTIDLSLTMIPYADYLEKKVTREHSTNNPNLGLESPSNPIRPTGDATDIEIERDTETNPPRTGPPATNAPEFNLAAMMG